MNQTKKRLSIISLAISITDIETIQLQVLKLGLLKTDEKIQEIIQMLKDENYAQCQELIQVYIDTPNHEILQRTFQEVREGRALHNMEEDEMFKMLDDFEGEKKEKTSYDDSFDSLLHIQEAEDEPEPAKTAPIEAAPSKTENTAKENFWEEENTQEEEEPVEDTFFKTREEAADEEEVAAEPYIIEETEEETEPQALKAETETAKEAEAETEASQGEEKESDAAQTVTVQQYKTIPYIDQKFKNMQVQYPVKERSDEHFSSVNAWLMQIAKQGYTETEIEEMIQLIQTLKQTQNAQAAQLLLITAATESKYAQFQLARELFKGELLEKNLPEAFTLINRLAVNDDYPEAICDLAQLYEYGIGIGKDRKKALALYEEAMEYGIQRASEHVQRLTKENKGFFSFLKK